MGTWSVAEVVAEREAEAARLEAEMAEVCGVLNAATGRLVGLIARVLETGAWEGHGIRSAEHWVAWRSGVSRGRARTLVAMRGGWASCPTPGRRWRLASWPRTRWR